MKTWLLAAGPLLCLHVISLADSIRIVPRDTVQTHCMASTSSGYVAAFDGKNFEIYTALASCGFQNQVPARCQAFVVPLEEAPKEVQGILRAADAVAVKHLVPAEDVVGVIFDSAFETQCKVAPIQKEKKIGPLKYPTSLKPLTEEETKRIEATWSKPKDKLLVSPWSSLGMRKEVRTGDVLAVAIEDGMTASIDQQRPGYLVAKYISGSDRDEYVLLEGRVDPPLGSNNLRFKVQEIYLLKEPFMLAAQTSNARVELQPVKVIHRRSSTAGFNWQGETTTVPAMKFRIIRMRSGVDRSIEIESDAQVGPSMHMRSVRRAQ